MSALLYKQDGPVVTLTINKPEVRNPVSDADVIDALVEACTRMNRDLSVGAAILTGAGTAFSTGGNLRWLAAPGGYIDSAPVENRRSYMRDIQRIPLAFAELEVPIIAAVNGPAMGAGCDVACMCDIRVAAGSAIFAESFVKVGITPGDGGAWLLPRAVGQSHAREMAFTGDSITAERALAIGLVSYVVEDDALLDKAREIAARITINPPHAVRMTKRLMNQAEHLGLPDTLHLSAAFQAIAHATNDHKEAVDAFLNKRKPVFNGN